MHYETVDPTGIVASAPGVGPILAPMILGRLGDAKRFRDLAAVRSYTSLVPRVSQSGVVDRHDGLTKSGDHVLRYALFLAADHARKTDPTLAAATTGYAPPANITTARSAPSPRARHPYRRQLAHRRALRPARPRRQPHQRSRGGRALHRDETPARSADDHGNGPAKQGVAERSIDRPVHHKATSRRKTA